MSLDLLDGLTPARFLHAPSIADDIGYRSGRAEGGVLLDGPRISWPSPHAASPKIKVIGSAADITGFTFCHVLPH